MHRRIGFLARCSRGKLLREEWRETCRDALIKRQKYTSEKDSLYKCYYDSHASYALAPQAEPRGASFYRKRDRLSCRKSTAIYEIRCGCTGLHTTQHVTAPELHRQHKNHTLPIGVANMYLRVGISIFSGVA